MKHHFLAIAALVLSVGATAQDNIKFADERLTLSGYLQGGIEASEMKGDYASTFYLKRARVSLTGNAKEEKIDYRLQVDMAGETPKICDLYFRYKPSTMFGLQLGQFKMPFAIENDIYGPTTVELIDYSYITTLLARNANDYDGIAATGRDIGFQIYGGFGDEKEYKTLSYNLGVFNGTGINTKDNNEAKDVVARLIYKPTKELSLSGSMMTAKTIQSLGRPEVEDKIEDITINSNRWSVGIIYDAKSFIVRSEYAAATFNKSNVQMYYILGGLKLNKDWMVIARYEGLNQEDIKDSRNRATLGAVYKPYPFLRCQLNYSLESCSKFGPNVNKSLLNLMLTAIF